MDIIKKIEAVLEESKHTGEYYKRDIPDPMMKMDIELNRIIENYFILSKEERASVRKNVSIDIAWTLLSFSEAMATYSLRLSDQRYFNNGLTSLGMALGLLDQRELLLIMPLYCDVSKKNKLSFDKILEQGDDLAHFVRNFLAREEKDKSLECMGYILTKDENNSPIYKRTW